MSNSRYSVIDNQQAHHLELQILAEQIKSPRKGTRVYIKSLLIPLETSVASFDDLDLLAKPVTCRRLPNLKIPHSRVLEKILAGWRMR